MRTHRNIRAIVVATILQNLVLAYVIERLFWESRSMSVQDVIFTEITYLVLVLLLEIPAGIIADRAAAARAAGALFGVAAERGTIAPAISVTVVAPHRPAATANAG